MERTSAAFWCYNCEKQFQGPAETEACVVCSCSAIELVDSSTQSNLQSSFQVYQIPSNNPQPNSNTQAPQNMQNNQPFPLNFTQTIFQFGMPQFQAFNAPFSPMAPNIFTIAESFAQSLLSPNGGIISLIQSLAGQRGLTPATNIEINQLEKVDRVAECSICQEEEDANVTNTVEKKGLKLKCGHMFHLDCIGPWFERTNTCPSCRVRI